MQHALRVLSLYLGHGVDLYQEALILKNYLKLSLKGKERVKI